MRQRELTAPNTVLTVNGSEYHASTLDSNDIKETFIRYSSLHSFISIKRLS